ncbi:MAG TPA: hypothetical protein VEE84_04135, partial [Burkholderiaceae bacterium]|nr:hypothetical protein [Burkholderiaceae bacterium]
MGPVRALASHRHKNSQAIVAVALLLAVCAATDGYLSRGDGMKSAGMGRSSATRTADAFGSANNPAEMVFAGNRFDVGIDWFK